MYKYNLMWQLTRMDMKGASLDDKLAAMLQFYLDYPSLENQDRVVNYLKGVYVNCKETKVLDYIAAIQAVSATMPDTDISIDGVPTKQLTLLYKDLFSRNKKWLKTNYRNSDLNDFIERLYTELTKRDVELEKNFDIIPEGKSTHKFIF